MIEVGRLCVKTAGRDAMEYCVIVEVVDEKYVLIDGNTRRKKVNKAHIEPLAKKFDLKKGATTKDVHAEFEKVDIEVRKSAEEKEKKEKKPQEKKVKKGMDKKEDKKATKAKK